MAKDFSFDIVSNYDAAEMNNAVDQAQRELLTRYDFKGTAAKLDFAEGKTGVLVEGESQNQLNAIVDMLQSKLVKRGISLKVLDLSGEPVQGGQSMRWTVPFRKGLDQDKAQVLMVRDIRQLARDAIVVDSADELGDPEEVVRLQQILDRHFKLVGLAVVSEMGSRLGRVETYSVNVAQFLVQKLYVKQPFVRNLLFNNLIIDRSQIVDVNDRQITVRDTGLKEPVIGAQPIVPE